jgi:hypothetical protein
MVSFGELKHKTVKPLQSSLNVLPLKSALFAKCTIHAVGASCFLFFLFSTYSVNRLGSPFLFIRVIIFVLLFSCAWGIFKNIFPGWAGTLFGWLWLSNGFERPANVCGCCFGLSYSSSSNNLLSKSLLNFSFNNLPSLKY